MLIRTSALLLVAAGAFLATGCGGASANAPASSTSVPDAEQTIAGLRPAFRACYNTGLQADPAMEGSVTLDTKVGADGKVTSVDVASKSGLSDAVATCLAGEVRKASFSAPGATGATLQVPVSFKKDQ